MYEPEGQHSKSCLSIFNKHCLVNIKLSCGFAIPKVGGRKFEVGNERKGRYERVFREKEDGRIWLGGMVMFSSSPYTICIAKSKPFIFKEHLKKNYT